jgi:hypothetical protein
MATNTIPGLPSIATPSSTAMLWLCDPSVNPQDRSFTMTNASLWFRKRNQTLSIADSPYSWDSPYDTPLLITTGGSAFELDLPAATGLGVVVEIIKVDSGSGSIEIVPDDTDAIDIAGNMSIFIDKKFQWVRLVDIAAGYWQMQQKSDRLMVSSSGAIGTLVGNNDVEYLLTAASTVTLPEDPAKGQRIIFRSSGAFTSVISANADQTIGRTVSTQFKLYAADDYVELEWDGSSVWIVADTNGPEIVVYTGVESKIYTTAWNPFPQLNTAVDAGIYDLDFCGYGWASDSNPRWALRSATVIPAAPLLALRGFSASSYAPLSVYLSKFTVEDDSINVGLYGMCSGDGGICINPDSRGTARLVIKRIG